MKKLGQLLDLVERGEDRDQPRAAIRRIRDRAEKLKLGPVEWAERKSYRDEGRP